MLRDSNSKGKLLLEGTMSKFASTPCIVPDNLSGTSDVPLVDYQPLQSHGAAGVDLTGADPHLGAQPVAKAVAKTSAAVPEHIA